MKIIVKDIETSRIIQHTENGGRYMVPQNYRVTSISVYDSLNECIVHVTPIDASSIVLRELDLIAKWAMANFPIEYTRQMANYIIERVNTVAEERKK
jgi:hypothetical protein